MNRIDGKVAVIHFDQSVWGGYDSQVPGHEQKLIP